jgi:starch-binding outer membrane protein, SusD/RagB family
MTNNLKNISIAILISGCLATSVSCNKKLDLDPRQAIEFNTAFKTEEELDQGIVGCYSLMGAAALYGTDLNLVSELLGSDGTSSWEGTFTQYNEIENKLMNSVNAAAVRIWVGGYNVINLANVIRDKLTSAEGAKIVPDEDRRNEMIGEAEFIRGLIHFELVRLYGKQYDATTLNTPGVVIKLNGATDTATASVKPARNTVAQTYTQIIADLISASQKLPERNSVRANKYTALAFLSRVYLQQGDYAKARDAANTVIEDGGYATPSNDLLTSFRSKNSAEVIFEIQQNDQNNAGSANDGLATFYADLENGIGRGDFVVDSGLIMEYPAGDKRLDAWYYLGAQYGSPATSKWYAYGQNIPIIRMAEMYLTRAECNRRLNTNVGATPAEDLAHITNLERTGVLIPVPSVNDIVEQRRLELAFEGLNIHDLRRLHRSTGSFPWDDDLLVMPIPQREIDATQGSLIQNEAYK